MNRTTDTGNKRWYVLLTLVGITITILVFVTGKNLPDFLKYTTPNNTNGAGTSQSSPVQDIRVRRAIAYCTDRSALAQAAYPNLVSGAKLKESI